MSFSSILCPLKKSFDSAGFNSSYALGWQRCHYDCAKYCNPEDFEEILDLKPNPSGHFWEGWSMSKESWLNGWNDCQKKLFKYFKNQSEEIKIEKVEEKKEVVDVSKFSYDD